MELQSSPGALQTHLLYLERASTPQVEVVIATPEESQRQKDRGLTHEHVQTLTSVLCCQLFTCAGGVSIIIELARLTDSLPLGWLSGVVLIAASWATLAWYVALTEYRELVFPRDFGLLACFTLSSSISLGLFGAYFDLLNYGHFILVTPLLFGSAFFGQSTLASLLFGELFQHMPFTYMFISHIVGIGIWFLALALYGPSSDAVVSLLGALFFTSFVIIDTAIASDKLMDDSSLLPIVCAELFIDVNTWLCFSGLSFMLLQSHVEDGTWATFLWFAVLLFVDAALLVKMSLKFCRAPSEVPENAKSVGSQVASTGNSQKSKSNSNGSVDITIV